MQGEWFVEFVELVELVELVEVFVKKTLGSYRCFHHG